MLLDLHNHTQYSPDSRVAPAQLVAVAQRMGLAGVAITDHNAVGGIRVAEAAARGGLGVDDVLQVLGQGRTAAQGIDRGAAATVRYVTKCVGQWFLRGMRRI